MSLDISHCGDNQSGVRGDYGCTQQIVASYNVDSHDTVYSDENAMQADEHHNELNHVYYSITAQPVPHINWLSLDYNLWITIIDYIPTKDLLRFKRCCKLLYNISILPICWHDREYEYTQHADQTQLSVNTWLQRVTTALYHVEKLSLSDTNLDDTGVQAMCRLPFLHSINLANTRITDVGLNQILNTYTHIQALNLIETRITNDGLKILANNRSLRSLAVSNNKSIDKLGWTFLANIREMSHLDITSVGTHKSTMNILHAIRTHDPPCSKLSRFSLHAQSNKELDLLAQFPNVQELQIEIYDRWIDDEPINWHKFVLKPSMHCLSIPYTKLCDNDLKQISDNRSLRSLHIDLNNPSYTDAGVSYVSRMTQLSELSLAAVCITDQAIQQLHSMSSLTTLSISRGEYAPDELQVTDAALGHIVGIKKLSMLRLAGIDTLTDHGLQQLNNCASLHKLVVERCSEISEKGVHALRMHNPALTAVRYDSVDLGAQASKLHTRDSTLTGEERMYMDGV